VRVHPVKLTVLNALELIDDYDIILDGTDNPGTKYMINDACVISGKPVVFAAISQFEGQVAVFNHALQGIETANYRDVFPFLPSADEDMRCNETGVLGVLPGIIGCLQCNETIKLITGIGRPLVNCLLVYNALTNEMREFDVQAKKENRLLIPKDKIEFMRMDYDRSCTAPVPEQLELNADEFSRLINMENITVIDVREPGASYSPAEFSHIRIPYRQLQEKLETIHGDTIITFCEHGIVSLKAARFLKEALGSERRIYSLNKGISYLNQMHRNTLQ
jgi:adenylyltransferase/sulfurtransferase